MKRTVVSFFLLLAVVCISYILGQYYHQRMMGGTKEIDPPVNNGFLPAEFTLQNKPFVIFVYVYNDGAIIEKKLRSIFSQSYDNYRLIYVDDASSDGSDKLANEIISQSQYAQRTIMIRNTQQCGFLANLVRAVQMCEDHEIVLVLPPEDWLAHEWVLTKLNQYYADGDLWLSYSQYREFPSYHLGSARNYNLSEWNCLREASFIATHGIAFVAELFKHIDSSDLMSETGDYYSHAYDMAFMLPLLEMGKNHFQFLPDILIISKNGQMSHEDIQKNGFCEHQIRFQKPYLALSSLENSSDELAVEEEEP